MSDTIKLNGRAFDFQADEPLDISVPLRFNGEQPNAYGVENARSTPYRADDLIGDTRLGGSVNFEEYSFVPHCNGTHTECVGHITDERISVHDCLRDVILSADLISVKAVSCDDDQLIDIDSLESAGVDFRSDALIIRTLPNDDAKLTRSYGSENIPPYFTADAMRYIFDCGFKHLLVDLPSIDRIFDDGKLENHRIFWNVEPGSRAIHSATRVHSTITELIYVPNAIKNGRYLLNLQIAPFASDASPSRPILFRTI